MSAATELGAYRRFADFHYPYNVTVFLIEQSYGSCSNSLLIRGLLGTNNMILTNFLVDNALHFYYLIRCHGNQMREVKPEPVRGYQRAPLLYMLAQNLAQSHLQQVGSCVVTGDVKTPLFIHFSLNFIPFR